METMIDLPADLRTRAERAAAVRGITLTRFVQHAIEVAVSGSGSYRESSTSLGAAHEPLDQPVVVPPQMVQLLVDPDELRAGFDALLLALGVDGESRGALALQEEMRREGSADLGLGQAIAEMREE